ncbi:hypothetical protein BC829DRAFT_446488 [Chytridium lagenaria]|nr:hypothetical protein BC829DRAFT_446488 [Chytridium lagenaria]
MDMRDESVVYVMEGWTTAYFLIFSSFPPIQTAVSSLFSKPNLTPTPEPSPQQPKPSLATVSGFDDNLPQALSMSRDEVGCEGGDEGGGGEDGRGGLRRRRSVTFKTTVDVY